MPDEESANVFAIPDFWKSSRWLDQPPLALPDKTDFFRLELSSTDSTLDPVEQGLQPANDGFFKLPSLLGHLDLNGNQLTKELPDEGIGSSQPQKKTQDEDLWLCQYGGWPKFPSYKTWDSFKSDNSNLSTPIYISEAGSGVYDALVAASDVAEGIIPDDQHCIIDPNAYCACLLSLSLGRSSRLFTWNDDKLSFVSTLDHTKVSGYSGDILQGVQNICLECGTCSQFLKTFVEETYASHATPSRVALANSVNKVLLTIQKGLGHRGQQVNSLLQLQVIVRPVQSVTRYFKALVIKLSRSSSEEQLLSLLFQEAQSLESGEIFLRDTIREVLRAVSKPWTDFVEEWIGLKAEKGIRLTKDGPGKSFVKIENRVWLDDMGFESQESDYFLDDEKMPSFIPDEVGQSLFETGRTLRFLSANHPDHTLFDPRTFTAAGPPHLEWQFDWESITRIECKALQYEQALSRALQKTRSTKSQDDSGCDVSPSKEPAYELQFFGKDEGQIEQRILASIAELDQPIANTVDDSLITVLQKRLFMDVSCKTSGTQDFTPHWSLLPLLSFGPIISAQARVINQECMKLLFGAHNLREHLTLLRNFQLLGNGVFCSRLSHALFDPELDIAERQAGVALSGGVMGLRLSGRESWPPASSELRLALMGVLSESYQPTHQKWTKHELPGDMSFAVRDLPPEEMDRCMDPDSIEALDFLRLSYKPPSSLMPVMTPMILTKYDRIFRLLLRVLRMLYVAHQLSRDLYHGGNPSNASTRFRIEARHFISSITAYVFDTGIAMPWLRFEAWLDGVQKDLEVPTATSRQSHSPDRLREYHEQILDEIMLALLLRKRQQPVLKLLEDIFTIILQFAKCFRANTPDSGGGDDEEKMKELYTSFRKKVEVFITVCKGLSEKGSYGMRSESRPGLEQDDRGASRGAEENTIVRLLLLLDMTGYYSRKPGP